ncbi:MAG: aldo/keto reductase [Myxococcales bacterium]|nr:MAG: aldo/keto reductase [Myxococcales bacterium]
MIDSAPVPRLLYGTAWKEERTEALTGLAISRGFRGIDTANQRKHYFEAAVGAAVQSAISRGEVSRAELFLQSKFTFRDGQDHRLPYEPSAPVAAQVQQSFESSLQHFSTDYLDSYVLHGPSSRSGLKREDLEAWRAIEALVQSGKVRFAGVSNFSLAQLAELLKVARVPPRFLQNRCYARTGWDRAVRRVCAEHGVVYQGFSLLTANREELGKNEVKALAARHGVSVAELVFAFASRLGMLPLTGTSSAQHMQTDLAALDLSLEPAEVQSLEALAG